MKKKDKVLKLIEKYLQEFDFGGKLSHLPYETAARLLLEEIETAQEKFDVKENK